MREPHEEAARLLRELRFDRGLSADEAAARMGVGRGVLTRAERGVSRPRPRDAYKIAAYYGLVPGEVWDTPIPRRKHRRERDPSITVVCTWCGFKGEYPSQMQIKPSLRGNVWACIDGAACDVRATRGEAA